jgi:hypothetical protein
VTLPHEPNASCAPAAQPALDPVPQSELLGLDAVPSRAEVTRLQAELSLVRQQRDDARAALSWIDSMAAWDAERTADDVDAYEAGADLCPAKTGPAGPAAGRRQRIRKFQFLRGVDQ